MEGTMARRSPQTVSLSPVSRAVDSAIRIAAKRHDVTVDTQTFIDRWELVGRRLRNVDVMNVAFSVAQDVTAAVRAVPGVRLQPVVSRLGRDILVGFIERSALPKIISR